MNAFLEKIAPLNHTDKIKKPMFIIQGTNDPRVPVTEAIQMRDKLKAQGNTVWYLDETTSPPTKRAICTVPRGTGPNPGSDYVGLSSFGVDANQELYMCQLSSLGGKIYKFSRTGPPPVNLPATLSATGTFSNLATLTPRAGLIGYLPNSPL